MKQLVAAAVLAVLAADVPVEEDPRAKVDVVGLAVHRGLDGEKRTQAMTGRFKGVTLTLRIRHDRRRLLGVDAQRSRLESFTDDGGTTLVDESANLLRLWLDGPMWVSPDGATLLQDIRASALPGTGARRLRLRGDLVLKCGRDRVETPGRLALRNEAGVAAGKVTFSVTGVQRGPKKTIVTLSTKDDPERIGRMQFADLAGDSLESELLQTSVVGFMGATYHDYTYEIRTDKPRVLDAVTVRIEHFRKIDRIRVPVEVEAGVGL